MEIPRPHDFTDSTVEEQSKKGGLFTVRRDHDSLTQGPDGYDIVNRVTGEGTKRK